MTRRAVLVAWLTAVWLALWGDLQWRNLLTGLGIGILFVVAFPPRGEGRLAVHPVGVARYGAHSVAGLVRASARLVAVVLNPRAQPQGAVIEVDMPIERPGVVALVAGSISLTPGTLVLETEPIPSGTRIRMHILDHTRDALERAEVAHLVELAQRAFGTERDPDIRKDS